MLFSFSLIFLIGMGLGKVLKKFNLPELLGTLITGMVLGPYMFNLLDPKILMISDDLRQMALIIILSRAGLNLDMRDLKKSGQTCFVIVFCSSLFRNYWYGSFST